MLDVDVTRAKELWSKAAEQGHSRATHALRAANSSRGKTPSAWRAAWPRALRSGVSARAGWSSANLVKAIREGSSAVTEDEQRACEVCTVS